MLSFFKLVYHSVKMSEKSGFHILNVRYALPGWRSPWFPFQYICDHATGHFLIQMVVSFLGDELSNVKDKVGDNCEGNYLRVISISPFFSLVKFKITFNVIMVVH